MWNLKKKKNRNKAFSLLEAVIALAILSIGLLAIINSEAISLKTFDFSQDNTVGAILARYQMTYFDFVITNNENKDNF